MVSIGENGKHIPFQYIQRRCKKELATKSMLKIALVNPPLSTEAHYGSLKGMAPNFPLLGTAFLSSYLNQFGFNVDLLDHSDIPFSQSLRILKGYDVVGFTAFITNYKTILELCNQLQNERLTTVVGGPHATLFPFDFERASIDYVVSGEGELPFSELLISIMQNRPVNKTAGLAYKKMGSSYTIQKHRLLLI